MKNKPGRKTDVKDTERIAGLLRLDLLTGNYNPIHQQHELRELGPHHYEERMKSWVLKSLWRKSTNPHNHNYQTLSQKWNRASALLCF
jgi:hypothetical protein